MNNAKPLYGFILGGKLPNASNPTIDWIPRSLSALALGHVDVNYPNIDDIILVHVVVALAITCCLLLNYIWSSIGKSQQPTLCLEKQTCNGKYFEEAWHRPSLVRSCSQHWLSRLHKATSRSITITYISIISVDHMS